jgi:protein SCO1
MDKPRFPQALLMLAAIAVLAGLATYWGLAGRTGQTAFPTNPSAPSQAAATRALIGGPFSLIDQNGKTVTDAMFRGRYMLVYFGFTYCPDVCPLDLQRNAAAMDLLSQREPHKATAVQPIFISLDPERDTPAALRDYVELFHPRLIGLTGSSAQVDSAKKAYRVYAAKREEPGVAEYLVDHTSITYLMGPDGGYIAHFASSTTPAEVAAKLGEFVKQ